MPSNFHMRTPCRPSAPPVSQLALFAASASNNPKPRVIMISARCRKRATTMLVRYPNSPAAAAAAISPVNGSPQPHFAIRPAV